MSRRAQILLAALALAGCAAEAPRPGDEAVAAGIEPQELAQLAAFLLTWNRVGLDRGDAGASWFAAIDDDPTLTTTRRASPLRWTQRQRCSPNWGPTRR